MAAYLQEVKRLAREFEWFKIEQIPRDENTEADSLAKLAFGFDFENPTRLPIEWLEKPSINVKAAVNAIGEVDNWTTPLVRHITNGELPQDKNEARRIKYLSNRFTMINGRLYKKGFSQPFLRCIDNLEAEFVMSQIHEGVCGNHSGGRALAQKALRQGYYWPTMVRDAFNFVQKCDKCQRFAHISHQPPAPLTSILIPWPFAKWGIDIIGPLPTAVGRLKYAIVAIDYFTKWVEAQPLANITAKNVTNFIWKSIICRFGIPHSIVTDNAKQFENASLADICEQLGISKTFAAPYHPQSNGQVEAVNKTIKENLKKKLESLKGAWVEEFPLVLWAYRTTARTSTGETPFSLTYGVGAVVPVEIGLSSYRTGYYDEGTNDMGLRMEMDVIEERREEARAKMAIYKQAAERYYNKKSENSQIPRRRLGIAQGCPKY